MAVSTQRPVGQQTPPHSEAPMGADVTGRQEPRGGEGAGDPQRTRPLG